MIKDMQVYLRTVGLGGFISGMVGKFTGSSRVMESSGHGMDKPLWVRVPSSDIWAFHQIFLRRDYAFGVNGG